MNNEAKAHIEELVRAFAEGVERITELSKYPSQWDSPSERDKKITAAYVELLDASEEIHASVQDLLKAVSHPVDCRRCFFGECPVGPAISDILSRQVRLRMAVNNAGGVIL